MTTAGDGTVLEYTADPAVFLAAAEAHLAADPVASTVVASVAYRQVAAEADGVARPERSWYVVVRDGDGAVAGVAMRTATTRPYPVYLLPMPEEAAVALARSLHARGEEVLGVNGARPAADACAAELARLTGARVEEGMHVRLHEVGELVAPRPVPGRLVTAALDDFDLVERWVTGFHIDADVQGGRPRGTSFDERPDPDDLRRRLRLGHLVLWQDGHGRPVHLTGFNPPSYGVARIGPVYTPPEERGRGWASAAVHETSRRLLAEGARVCLFTDQANPVSNRLYAALGYRPVVDTVSLRIVS